MGDLAAPPGDPTATLTGARSPGAPGGIGAGDRNICSCCLGLVTTFLIGGLTVVVIIITIRKHQCYSKSNRGILVVFDEILTVISNILL